MAVLGPCAGVNMNGHNIQNQLSKSLERILEDAYLSGELKLRGRKLTDFPRPLKYDLSDTVSADLSKNRFVDFPDEVTTYVFLEKLLLSQNTITALPDAVGGLQSLTFLDLSSNQLTELPREICQMPLQVLLVSDNCLSSLPKEVGKMHTLAELDASRNRLTQIPMTMGECTGLRALDLSNNQLGLLPLQITYLQLEHLDVSSNCISSLPLELRNMSSLVTLELDNNPLVSPPITVCMRGRVHIFKYLENMANKESMPHKRVEDTRRTAKHSSFLGTTAQGHQITSGNATIDCLRHRPRPVVDSGYSTDGVDKRWSNDGDAGGSGRSTPSTPSTLSPGAALSRQQSLSSENSLAPLSPLLSGVRISPEAGMNGDDKNKMPQQTYRQYKEALRQQRTQDVYRPRAGPPSPDDSPPSPHCSPLHLPHSHSSPHSPLSNGHNNSSLYKPTITTSTSTPNTSQIPNSPLLSSTPRRNGIEKEENKRPVQKVVPSRNVNKIYPTNGNLEYQNGRTEAYTKPTSPTKSPMLGYNRLNGNGDAKLLTTTVSYVKGAAPKPPKMSWNKDVAADKLSFTMKREFDKQKEELDLLQQLRVIIESRLKMQLPSDLAPALSDGVVLCHLANHVRPRAVASVHVPSPAQPTLTMARCRRNVENFIEACRRIGVEEDAVCAPGDVTGEREGLGPLARTVLALAHCAHATPRSPNDDDLSQSDTSQHSDDQPQAVTEYYSENPLFCHVNFNKYSRYNEERYVSNFNCNEQTIDESEEYEHNNEDQVNYSPIYGSNEMKNRGPYYHKNKVQFVTPFKESGILQSDSMEIYDTDEVDFPVEAEQEQRYDRNKMNLDIKNNLNTDLNEKTETELEKAHRQLVTILCLGSFFISAIILYLHPL